jgi:hypothetical protein
MTTGDWAFALVTLLAVMCAAVCAVAWKVAYQDGWEARGLHDANLRNERRIEQNRERAAPLPPWPTAAERLADTGELAALYGGEYPVPPPRISADYPHGEPCREGCIESTGELRAVTNLYIEDMEREEAAWREGLLT